MNTGITIPETTDSNTKRSATLRERGRSGGAEDLLVADPGRAVRQREGEVLAQQLLDVGAPDIIGLLDLDNAEDLGEVC